jgi:tetratricopeptide (TPR) repeat protein
MSDDLHRQDLIQVQRKNLAVLEQQRAGYGELDVPLRILNQIDAIQRKIAALEAEAAAQSQAAHSPVVRGNLPRSADPFVGRERELAELAERLAQGPCVAIHSLGGMGKTALAQAVGRRQHELGVWPDGVWLVELRNITSAALARTQIAVSLGLDPKVSGENAALAAALRSWHALLLLDDLDAMLRDDRAGAATLLRGLLGCPDLRLLVTSRADLPGQVAHDALRLERLLPADAEDAFRRYAPPLERWGKPQPADLQAVLQFLDGYPFPIRLAATYMKQTRCDLPALRARLAANPQGTLRYPGDAEDRETSLAATLDLSFQALPDDAKQTLPLLALFPAGLTRAAARAILGADSEPALEALLQHAMAEYRDEDSEARFALPEPARGYAETKQPAGAMEQYAPAALEFFHSFVSNQIDQFETGKYEVVSLLTLEQPNLYRFLDWGCENELREDGISLSARAVGLLRNYWRLTDAFQFPQTLDRLQKGLEAAERNTDRWGEAKVRKAIGDVQKFCNQRDAALANYQRALMLFQTVGDQLGEASVLQSIGSEQKLRNEWDAALASYKRALSLNQAMGNQKREAEVLLSIGDLQQYRNEGDAALLNYRQSLTLFQRVGDHLGYAYVLASIADIHHFRGEWDVALINYDQALNLSKSVGNRLGEANVLAEQARIALHQGNDAQARQLHAESIELFRAIGDWYSIAAKSGNYGLTLRALGRHAEACDYFRQAAELYAEIGMEERVQKWRRLAEEEPE